MTLEQYKNLIKEFSLYYYDDSSSESQYGPDAYIDEGCTESVCGWRRSSNVYFCNARSWESQSLIMYDRGSWNGKYATTVKTGRKLLNEFFRGRKLKEIEQRKENIKKAGAKYVI